MPLEPVYPAAMRNRFTGKVALVAGGANANPDRLLGFAGLAALEIARDGGSVVIADIDDEAGQESVRKMRDEGLNAHYIHVDVTSEQDWQAAVELTLTEYGRLDIMIFAAGLSDRGNPLDTIDVERWKRVMDVTNLGMFFGVRSVVGPMTEAGGCDRVGESLRHRWPSW